ncbi:MAG: SusC/RagA family TonB-linked outer membrane protein [Candidatus Cryptobacteroides sp.]
MKRILSVMVLLQAFLIQLAAQNMIKGTVTDENGNPMTGAAVVVPGTKNYFITGQDGTFTISASKGDVLNVSYLGYDDLNVTVTDQSVYDLSMIPSAATMLDETVVIGYGTSTKKEITGSVTSLRGEDFDKGAYIDASAMLQGKVAGLSITNPNGADPNGSMEILLRGTNTLSAGQGPLIIIDGVSGADIRSINFQEVESMDVLKDGSAAAIYGTRGTNGVIIITTKRAKAGKTSVEYDGQVSVQTLLSRAEPMTAEQFRYTVDNYVPSASASLYGAETDWFDEVTRTPVSHRHSLAVAGGSENFSHRTTLNVEQNQGLLKNNDSKKYLIKTNIHQEAIQGWLTFDYNVSYAKRKFNGTRTGIFRQAFLHNPTEPVYDDTDTEHGGYFTVSSMDYYNPVAMLNERSNNYDVDMVSANTRATLNILAVKGLKWDNFVNWSMKNSRYTDYKTRYYPGEWGLGGSAEIDNSRTYDVQYESTIQYANKFGDHSVQAILGYSYEQQTSDSSGIYNYGFDTDWFGVNNIGSGKALLTGNASISSYKESNKYIAFFGRVMYNYADRYMLSVSLRRDGSSRFGANNKWGWFPAVSVGWRISQEKFLKDVKWLDELKLRAGFGMTGNQDFSNYQSLFLVKTNGNFYYDGKWNTAYAPASNANPDLRWEKKSEYNVGLDFSFLKGRLGGTIDYYYRLTTDLLYNYTVPVPPYDYSTLFTNVGKISNSGIEVTINAIPVQTKNVVWSTALTFAHNKNKLISFTNDQFSGQEYRIGWLNSPLACYCQRLIEGESIGTFYGPEYEGIRSSGSIKVAQSSEKEWVKLGNAYPICDLGWSNNLRLWDFTLSATFRASIGGKAFNQMRAVYESVNEFGLKNVLASWLDEPEFTGKTVYCSKYLEDASFLKLDNLTLAYNVPLKKRNVVKSLSFSLTGQNLFVLTGYKGVDPEVQRTGLTPGIEGLSYYPRTRVFTFGASIKF